MRRGRVTKQIRTGEGTIALISGTEGPKHDPYGYSEIWYTRGGTTIGLHEGFETYIIANGQKGFEGSEAAAEAFEALTGLSKRTIERALERKSSKCSRCGSKQSSWVQGYPGEHLLQCDNCGVIMDSDFYLGEIE